MKEKKLIVLIPSIEGGGVEKNFFLIANYLSQYLKDITVITTDKSIRKRINKKINIIAPQSNFWSRQTRLIKYLLCLYKLLLFALQNKNILIFSFQANVYAIILSKILRIKIITRSNSSSEGWSKNIIKKFLYKIFLNLSDQVIAMTLKKSLIENLK